MNRKKLKILIILLVLVLVIYLMSGSIVKFITYLKDAHMINSVITGFCTIISAVIAIIGVHFTINNNQKLKNKELLNSLDQKSEWRKKLMNIAAKPVMNLEDVHRVLASLRFLPKNRIEIKNSNQEDFDEISNYIYTKLNDKINTFYIDNKINLDKSLEGNFYDYRFNIRNSEEIRQYIKFLLKHHWEYNQNEEEKRSFMAKEKKEFEKVKKQIDKINDKENNTLNLMYDKINFYETEEKELNELKEKQIEKSLKRLSKFKFIVWSIYIIFIVGILILTKNNNVSAEKVYMDIKELLDYFAISGITYAFLIAASVALFTLIKDFRDNIKEFYDKANCKNLKIKELYITKLKLMNKIVFHMTIMLIITIIIGIISYTINCIIGEIVYEVVAIVTFILQLVSSLIIFKNSSNIHEELIIYLKNK